MDSGTPTLETVNDPHSLLTPRRVDIAVKWRFFRGMCGPSHERVYRWHIEERVKHRWATGYPMDVWKRSIDDYVEAAKALFKSMESGFDGRFPIPVDPNGELLNGSHRLACALALGLPVVIEHMDQEAWAPSWDMRWFVEHGMDTLDLVKLEWDFLCLSS